VATELHAGFKTHPAMGNADDRVIGISVSQRKSSSARMPAAMRSERTILHCDILAPKTFTRDTAAARTKSRSRTYR